MALAPYLMASACPRCGELDHLVVSTDSDTEDDDPLIDTEGYVREVLRDPSNTQVAFSRDVLQLEALSERLRGLTGLGGLLVIGVNESGSLVGWSGDREDGMDVIRRAANHSTTKLRQWGTFDIDRSPLLYAIVEADTPSADSGLVSPRMSRLETWQAIRMTRARPPGRASLRNRRVAYRAALQQFEELMVAAQSASSASRPLLLYYATTQGGIALMAAARRDLEFPPHHGLTFPRVDTRLEVREIATKAAGIFPAMCATLGFQVPSAQPTIGELWKCLPELTDFRLRTAAPSALRLWPYDESSISEWSKLRTNRVGAVIDLPEVSSYGQVAERLSNYPSTLGWQASAPNIGIQYAPTPEGMGIVLYWGAAGESEVEHRRKLDEIAPHYRDRGRWVLPTVSGCKRPLPPFLTWWLLLYGLSMLCRYEPVTWSRALDIDRSEIAVGLEALLEEALTAIPDLIHELVTSRLTDVETSGQARLFRQDSGD